MSINDANIEAYKEYVDELKKFVTEIANTPKLYVADLKKKFININIPTGITKKTLTKNDVNDVLKECMEEYNIVVVGIVKYYLDKSKTESEKEVDSFKKLVEELQKIIEKIINIPTDSTKS